MTTTRTLPFRPGRALAAGTLCAVTAAAIAQVGPATPETSPYSAGAGLGVAHDDNVFRAPSEQAIGDQQRTALVFGDLDQRYGRQRLQGHAELRDHSYRARRELNHQGYNGKLGWEGSTIGDVSWLLSQETSRRLASYGTVQDPAFSGNNIETVDQTLAELQLGMVAEWVAKLALSHRRVDHTAAAFDLQQVRLDSVGAGLQWRPLGPLSASVGPRVTRGRVPAAADGIDRGFMRHDLDFGVRWVPTGQSELRARLSLTRQRYETAGQRDFNGATGQLAWQWAVSGRTRVNTALSRETGSETVFFAPPGAAQILRGTGDDSQLTTVLSTRVDHELTGKIGLALDLQLAHRKLAASKLLADGSVAQLSGSDRSALVKFGVRYAPTRSVLLACEMGHELRTSSTPLSSAYRVNTVGCNGQITLRWS